MLTLLAGTLPCYSPNVRSIQEGRMSADADHEVIDSPEALFRHLYEEHHVEEALDLDPETAPVQFWLRRHAELEREARTARRAEPAPQPPAAPEPPAAPRTPTPPDRPGHPLGVPRTPPPAGRRPAGFGDPLVEAVARALAGRGHDEAAVRGAIRAYSSPGGGRTGEAAVRGDFVEPMLRAAAERLLGAADHAAQPSRATHAPAPAPSPREAGRREEPRPEGARPEERAAPAASRPEGSGEPQGGAPVGPEAAWAGLWADLGDGGTRRSAPPERAAGADDDDLMAIADAVQRRRGRRALRR
jgi:hypothetical protein